MHKIKAAIAGILSLFAATAALAQSGVANFPQTLPPNTVVGRLNSGTGPSQAIPFSVLGANVSPVLNVQNYGAKCSGLLADASANAKAFTQALSTGRNVFVPYCSAGYNLGTNPITLQSGQSVSCENQATVIYGQGAKVFYINSLGPETKVENCTVQMAGAPAGSTAFRLATSLGIVNVATLRNVKCLYSYECIGDEGTNAVGFLTVDGAYATQTYGRQFHLANSNGFIRLSKLNCDFTNEVGIGLVTWGCAEFDNFVGLTIEGLSAATNFGVGTPSYTSVPAFKFFNGQALWIGTLFADTTAGDGILIDTVNYVWADKLEASVNLGYGIKIQNGTKANITNLICIGGVGITGASASKNGCEIANQANTNIANAFVEKATGSGMVVSGTSSGVNIANLVATTSTGTGLVISGTSTAVNVTNAMVGGNTGGGYSNTSSGANFVTTVSGGTQWAVQSAPGSPPASNGAFWFDSVDLRWHDKGATGTIGTTVVASTCSANQFANTISSAGVVGCAQPSIGNLGSIAASSLLGNPSGLSAAPSTVTLGSTLAFSGTTLQTGAGSGDCTWSANSFSVTCTKITGTTTNDNATAGKVGEFISSTIASGSAVSLTTATPVNLTSISLTAGDWDVDAVFDFIGNTTTTTSSFSGSVSTTSATHDFTGGRGQATAGNTAAFNQIPAGQAITLAVPQNRFSLSSTTTVFAVASAVFATSTNTVYGIIRARRVR